MNSINQQFLMGFKGFYNKKIIVRIQEKTVTFAGDSDEEVQNKFVNPAPSIGRRQLIFF